MKIPMEKCWNYIFGDTQGWIALHQDDIRWNRISTFQYILYGGFSNEIVQINPEKWNKIEHSEVVKQMDLHGFAISCIQHSIFTCIAIQFHYDAFSPIPPFFHRCLWDLDPQRQWGWRTLGLVLASQNLEFFQRFPGRIFWAKNLRSTSPQPYKSPVTTSKLHTSFLRFGNHYFFYKTPLFATFAPLLVFFVLAKKPKQQGLVNF